MAHRVTALASVGTLFTGLALLWFYHPNNRLLSVAHVVMVALAIQGLVASSVLSVVRGRRPNDSFRALVVPATLLVIAVGGWVVALGTGLLLGWDQLALEDVVVGDTYRGFGWVLGNDVVFALVGTTIVEVSAIVRTLIVHLVAAGVTVLAGIVLPRRRARVGNAAPPSGG